MEIIIHTAESSEMLHTLARTALHHFQWSSLKYHRYDYCLVCHGVHVMVCVRQLVYVDVYPMLDVVQNIV